MDPQVRGALLGALGASSFATLLYLMGAKRGNKTQTQQPQITLTAVEKKNDEMFYALLGDIGGTNVRYVLKRMHPTDRKQNHVIKEDTFDIQKSPSFEQSIRGFLTVRSLVVCLILYYRSLRTQSSCGQR